MFYKLVELVKMVLVYRDIRQFEVFEFEMGDGFIRMIEFESNPKWDAELGQYTIEQVIHDSLDGFNWDSDDGNWDIVTLERAKYNLDLSHRLEEMFAG